MDHELQAQLILVSSQYSKSIFIEVVLFRAVSLHFNWHQTESWGPWMLVW